MGSAKRRPFSAGSSEVDDYFSQTKDKLKLVGSTTWLTPDFTETERKFASVCNKIKSEADIIDEKFKEVSTAEILSKIRFYDDDLTIGRFRCETGDVLYPAVNRNNSSTTFAEENKNVSHWRDAKTVGFGRRDKVSHQHSYVNPFDPSLTFQGLALDGEPCSAKQSPQKPSPTNLFLAANNSIWILEDYLQKYRNYLRILNGGAQSTSGTSFRNEIVTRNNAAPTVKHPDLSDSDDEDEHYRDLITRTTNKNIKDLWTTAIPAETTQQVSSSGELRRPSPPFSLPVNGPEFQPSNVKRERPKIFCESRAHGTETIDNIASQGPTPFVDRHEYRKLDNSLGFSYLPNKLGLLDIQHPKVFTDQHKLDDQKRAEISAMWQVPTLDEKTVNTTCGELTELPEFPELKPVPEPFSRKPIMSVHQNISPKINMSNILALQQGVAAASSPTIIPIRSEDPFIPGNTELTMPQNLSQIWQSPALGVASKFGNRLLPLSGLSLDPRFSAKTPQPPQSYLGSFGKVDNRLLIDCFNPPVSGFVTSNGSKFNPHNVSMNNSNLLQQPRDFRHVPPIKTVNGRLQNQITLATRTSHQRPLLGANAPFSLPQLRTRAVTAANQMAGTRFAGLIQTPYARSVASYNVNNNCDESFSSNGSQNKCDEDFPCFEFDFGDSFSSEEGTDDAICAGETVDERTSCSSLDSDLQSYSYSVFSGAELEVFPNSPRLSPESDVCEPTYYDLPSREHVCLDNPIRTSSKIDVITGNRELTGMKIRVVASNRDQSKNAARHAKCWHNKNNLIEIKPQLTV